MRLAAILAALLAGSAAAEGVREARFADPTTRYDHAVLGDAVEWGTLEMVTTAGRRLRLILPETRVFEDVVPRIADLDGDGRAEVVAVESDLDRGARLAVWGPDGLVAATDFIGMRHRWLAPAGIADLDGDGRLEIAFVDRPHLARVLRVVRLEGGRLVPVAALPGVTNHRIGEPTISGGVRDCGSGPELVLADAGWRRAVAVRLRDGALGARDLGPLGGGGLAAALGC